MEAIIGWIGNLFFVGGGLYKSPRTTMIFYTAGNGLYIVMYLQMGLLMAALAVGLVCLRNFSGILLSDRNNYFTQIILTILLSVLIIGNIEYMLDVLVLLAGWSVAMAYFYRDDFHWFRFYNSISQILWMTHSYAFGVWPMFFTAALILATNIYAVIVYTPALRDALIDPFRARLLKPIYVRAETKNRKHY